MSVCVFLASDFSETIEVVMVNLGMVTASDMGMHHGLITLTLTIIHGHTDINHENNKCLINISETISSNAHQVCCCEDSSTKGRYDHGQSDDLDLHSSSRVRCVSNLNTFQLAIIISDKILYSILA